MYGSISDLTSGQLSHQPSPVCCGWRRLFLGDDSNQRHLFLDLLISSPSSYSQLSKFRYTEYRDSNLRANRKQSLFPWFLIIIYTFVNICSRNVAVEPEAVALLSRIKLKRWNTVSFLSVMKWNYPQYKWQLWKAIFAVMDKS